MNSRHTQINRNELEQYVWDAYKDVHGIRPRWVNWKELSDKALTDWADRLQDEIDAVLRAKAAHRDAVYAALDNPMAHVFVHPAYDMTNSLDRRYVVDCITHDNLSVIEVVVLPEAPKNNPFAVLNAA